MRIFAWIIIGLSIVCAGVNLYYHHVAESVKSDDRVSSPALSTAGTVVPTAIAEPTSGEIRGFVAGADYKFICKSGDPTKKVAINLLTNKKRITGMARLDGMDSRQIEIFASRDRTPVYKDEEARKRKDAKLEIENGFYMIELKFDAGQDVSDLVVTWTLYTPK